MSKRRPGNDKTSWHASVAGEKSHKAQLLEELLTRLKASPEMSPLIAYLISSLECSALEHIYIVATQMGSLKYVFMKKSWEEVEEH